MRGKELLGTISPVIGTLTGQGMFGKLSDKLGYGMGILPGILAEQRRKKRDAVGNEVPDVAAEPAQPAMKKGGKVKKMAAGGSASKRADGCATKGKTRGKMV